jgi:predicted lipoprotein with Yx(FWY)xxD motif
MRKAMKVVPLVVLCALIVAVPSVWASWMRDGVVLSTAVGDQMYPQIISDGAGGVIATWFSAGDGTADIYSQRVNASGSIQWTTDGVPLCTATGSQWEPTLVSDGAGGAIVTWQDYRSGSNYDIYAQRINASGAVQWTTDGVPLCTATTYQYSPIITSDGAGGAIVAWVGESSWNYHIYAQKVNASGTIQWATDGVPLCTATGNQSLPAIISDGAGGAIVTWVDHRSVSPGIYAQRVDASGTIQWTTDGAPLCTATGTRAQSDPTIVSDGAGGAIVAWEDIREGTSDICAQRVNASGSIQWATDGVPVCAAAGGQRYPKISSDDAGGAIVAWEDSRSGTPDIYAQRVNASGSIQWATDGVPVCAAAAHQWHQAITSDGAGGAVVAWHDGRSGNDAGIYAQRVNASGAVLWTADGVPLCEATGWNPAIVSNDAGGAVVTWFDQRGGTWDVHIYAQRVTSTGIVGSFDPAIHSIRDVPGDQGGYVNLAWDASPVDYVSGDITRYTIWRALSTPAALMMVENGAELLSGPEEVSSSTGKPQVRMQQISGRTFYWSLIDSHDAYYLQNYSKIVATAFDSSSTTTEYNYFQIIAHTSDARTFYVSAPDSGRSVDNIAPCPPTNLEGERSYTPAGLTLTWDRNTDADLGHYSVYRGTSADFVPGVGNIIDSPPDTTALDGSWSHGSGYYYKVSALDIHGNESGFALLRPEDINGTETPRASYLAQNYPNPFNPTTRITFGLSAPGHVSLRIYDAAGRLVRALVDEERPVGRYEESWDGRDSGGRAVASGIYFYRLVAGGFEETKKMALMR